MSNRISVVLPCFNAADTLEVQLEALARQSWAPDADLIVVDNGSSDGTLELVEKHRASLPPLRVIQAFDPARGRQGVAASYALAIASSDADAFLFCEADDEVGDNWFVTMAAALEEHELVAAALEYQRLNGPEFARGDEGQQSVSSGLWRTQFPPRALYASGCSMGFRRSVVDQIGAPDVNVGPVWDVEYCIKAAEVGITIEFVPQTVVHYRLRHTVRARYSQGRAWGRANSALLVKYRNPTSLRLGLSAVKRAVVSAGRLRRVVLRRSTFRRWVWDWGWTIGTGQGVVDAVRSRHPRSSSKLGPANGSTSPRQRH